MSTRPVLSLLAAAALAAPLTVGAAPAGAAAGKFHACTGTANGGEQSHIKVRKVTCANAISFLEKIAKKAPDSTRTDGGYTVATLKTGGWTCTLRFKPATADNPTANVTAHGVCTASKQRAIHWTKSF